MKHVVALLVILLVMSLPTAECFSPFVFQRQPIAPLSRQPGALHISVGLGPEDSDQDQNDEDDERELVAGIDYQIPDHEAYRTSRRSIVDTKCDAWFETLLENTPDGFLGPIAQAMRTKLLTPVKLTNEYELEDTTDPEWTPYVSTRLPWTPLVPAYGLEQFGIPVPRKNAEAWRQFDVLGMIAHNFTGVGKTCESMDWNEIEDQLKKQGGWAEDSDCEARMVYINGEFSSELSKVSSIAHNLDSIDDVVDNHEVQQYLARLTDGFTDELVVPVTVQEWSESKLSRLSSPHHNLKEPTSQFAINAQQGSACFAALNTIKTNHVAMIHSPSGFNKGVEHPRPIVVINAVTRSAGSSTPGENPALHPRVLVVAEAESNLAIVQHCVDISHTSNEPHCPKLYNGYTQFFVKDQANVSHSYVEATGGTVIAGVEQLLEARNTEMARPELRDTHLETIDVHLAGEDATYKGTILSVGGSGRIRFAHSITLLKAGAMGELNGFMLSGGAQRNDMRTNMHHIAQGTYSNQLQKNMVGGRATGAFRGRVRVEQSAQQTDSTQLSRSILLSNQATTWAVPSLEVIADDVKCAHGASVSDLSDEELFYLRARGMNRPMARNLLMYGFAGDVASKVHPSLLGDVDGGDGIKERIIQKLENLVPMGDRAIKDDFRSI